MRDGPEPRERAAPAGGHHRHFGEPRRYIQLCPRRIVELKFVQRHLAALADGPLVGLVNRAEIADLRHRHVHEPAHDGGRLPGVNFIEDLAVVGKDREAADPIRRSIQDREQR
jgi:hypothetical protein